MHKMLAKQDNTTERVENRDCIVLLHSWFDILSTDHCIVATSDRLCGVCVQDERATTILQRLQEGVYHLQTGNEKILY